MRITHHAIERYLERIEPCSRDDVEDRLQHALSISQPATGKQLAAVFGEKGKGTARTGRVVFRYCPVESLMLVCGIQRGQYALLTVYRVAA